MSTKKTRGSILNRVIVLAALVAVMWALLALHVYWPRHSVNHLAIRPHATEGLWRVLLAPFLHRDVEHLTANTVPFLLLGGLVLAKSAYEFAFVTFVAMVGAGAGAWYFGRPGELHLGASGLIFGYLGFLLARGLFDRTLGSLAIAAVVGFVYGGLVLGVFPQQPDVSWQSHAAGFAAGITCGWLLSGQRPQ